MSVVVVEARGVNEDDINVKKLKPDDLDIRSTWLQIVTDIYLGPRRHTDKLP